MDIALAAVGAAIIGWFGPVAIRRLPEPTDLVESDPKTPYVDIAAPSWLPYLLAVSAAVMAGVVAWGIDRNELLPAWAVVCGVGSWLGYVDARTRYLPRRLTDPLFLLVLAVIGAAALLTWQWRLVTEALLGAVVVYVIFRLIWELGRFFRGGAFGYGDVRLAAILGLVLGPLGVTVTGVGLYAGFVLGVVIGFPLVLLGAVDRRHVAFGPYLLAGAVIGAVWPAITG